MTTNSPAPVSEAKPTSRFTLTPSLLVSSGLLAIVVWLLAGKMGLWPLATVIVVAFELFPERTRLSLAAVWRAMPRLLMGVSVVIIIAALPKAISQAAVALGYFVWRYWAATVRADSQEGLVSALIVQGAAFEAVFLMAALWHVGRAPVIIFVWLAAYVCSYALLAARGDRTAGIMAATWALVAAEASWVFMAWLISYIGGQSYVIVPQPVVVLTALAYCYGNIYLAQRQGKLSRGRLTEYLLIGLILIAIVVAGTPWRNTV